MSPSLVPGGRFAKGDPILKLEAKEFQAALRTARLQVQRAQVDFRVEQSRGTVAASEWELAQKLTGRTSKSGGEALALRKPQSRAAKSAVHAAFGDLEHATMALDQTGLKAPFDAFVDSESVDVGDVILPGRDLGVLVGTESLWVKVSLPVQSLSNLRLPEGTRPGAEARIWQQGIQNGEEYTGRLIRLLGRVADRGYMAQLLLEIQHPYERPPGSTPLLIGNFVHVEIEGDSLRNVVEVPRVAVRLGDVVFLASKDNKVEVRAVKVLWKERETALVTGVEDGERVILTLSERLVQGAPVEVVRDLTQTTPNTPIVRVGQPVETVR